MVIFKTAVDIKTGIDVDNAATYTVTMRLRRLSLYYIVNLVVPCCLLSFIAVATFLLPAGSSDRLGMGTYVLIVMVQGALSDIAIRPSVPWHSCLGTLAACSFATAGHQKCADCRPVRRSAAIATVELPSAGAYRLAAPRAIPCRHAPAAVKQQQGGL